MSTATKTARSVVASTTNTSGGTARGRVDLTTAFGGLLTFKMTNGGTGPSAECKANILVSHNASQPAAASAGADWKTIYSVGNGTTAGTVGEYNLLISPAVMQLEVEFTGNTGQSVTVEAWFSELTSVS